MRIRSRSSAQPASPRNMTALIDVVFLLLIFLLLTLKVLPPEGDFALEPLAAAPLDVRRDDPPPVLPKIRVRLEAERDGSLKRVRLGERVLGNDARAFERLNVAIGRLVGPGPTRDSDLEVEIDADYRLDYRHVIDAVSACSGRLDPKTGRRIRYVEKIKFAPPRREGDSGVSRRFDRDDDDGSGVELPDIEVRMLAADDGSLERLLIGRRDLGHGESAFEALNERILEIIGEPGNPLVEDIAVSIRVDERLKHPHILQAIEACRGRVDPETREFVPYVGHFKLARLRRTDAR